MTKTLYQRLTEAGCETSNHESDLYVRYDDTAKTIIDEYRKENGLTGWGLCSFFTNQVEGGRWIDIPFAFDPFWERVTKKAAA